MTKIVRSFYPGSEWLYFKIYLGISTADDVLKNTIKPLMNGFLRKSWIDKWFFIRYSDPDYHLRLRLHVVDPTFIGDILVKVNNELAKYIDTQLIHRICIDTYEREIERYGERQMIMSESVFYIDSVYTCDAIKVLSLLPKDYRWWYALYSIDHFLTVFKMDNLRKRDLMNKLSGAYKTEFGFNEHNSKSLNSLFRKNRKLIDNIVSKGEIDKSIHKIIHKRDSEFLKLSQEPKFYSLDIPSCLHMMMNRLFEASNREIEMILYFFLYHEYESLICRNKLVGQASESQRRTRGAR